LNSHRDDFDLKIEEPTEAEVEEAKRNQEAWRRKHAELMAAMEARKRAAERWW
jgi:hypothetical protein